MDFVNFLVENWKVFAVVAAIGIETFIMLFFKRKPVLVDNSICFRLAEWIEEAEKHYSTGDEKIFYVLSKAEAYLGDQYDASSVRGLVEWILSLPQKKGVNDEK